MVYSYTKLSKFRVKLGWANVRKQDIFRQHYSNMTQQNLHHHHHQQQQQSFLNLEEKEMKYTEGLRRTGRVNRGEVKALVQDGRISTLLELSELL